MGTANKGKWYKLLIEKMDQALINKYYFEAIFIEYMIIDDRMKALATMAGIDLLRPDGNPKMIGQLIDDLKSAKKQLTVPQWKMLDVGIPLASDDFLKAIKKELYPIERINECTHAPRAIINVDRSGKSGKYISKYGDRNAPLLVQIQKWVTLRNHWMHAAGNDALSLEEYEAEITPLAIDGASFTREMCDVTSRIKRHISR